MSLGKKVLACSFCLIFLHKFTSASSYPAFICSNHLWPIQLNDTKEMGEIFQNWIYAWQNNCVRQAYLMPAPNSGIGSSVNEVIKYMVSSVELGKLYRPDEQNRKYVGPGIWMYADNDPNKCTLHMRTIDCFTQPLSVCGYDEKSILNQLDKIKRDVKFADYPLDSCEMAKLARKPLQWVAAQYTSYMLRLGDNIRDEVEEKMKYVFGVEHHHTHNHNHSATTAVNHNISANATVNTVKHSPLYADGHRRRALSDGTKTHSAPRHHTFLSNITTIGVHIRAGDIDVDGRKVQSLDAYMRHVDAVAEKLKNTDKPVGLVFLCSHIQEENVISSEHMQKTYVRPFRFSVLPHTEVGHIEVYLIAENKTSEISKRDMAVQFYTDIEILSRVDYFIGSMSNMYTLVTGMRIARNVHKHNNQSCQLDIVTHPNGDVDMHCEGSAFVKNQWVLAHAGSFQNKHTEMDWLDLP